MELVRFGLELDVILDMDLFAFNSAYESAISVIYAHKLEDAWTAIRAAQATPRELKKWTDRWVKLLRGRSEEKQNDQAEFLSKFSKGI